jgi:hypothetical protein
MSDHSFNVVSLVILGAAKDLTNAAFPTLQRHPDKDPGREIPHFFRDDLQLSTTQPTLQEHL